MAEHDDQKKPATATKTKKRWTRLRICLKAPIKLLSTVRDLYVGSITNCAGQASSYGCGSSLHRRSSVRSPTTKSFSSVSLSNSTDNRGLVRAVSGRIRPVGEISKKGEAGGGREWVAPGKLQRSFTTGWFETIDEEKECEFGGEVRVSTGSLYPRRRRHCVSVTPLPHA